MISFLPPPIVKRPRGALFLFVTKIVLPVLVRTACPCCCTRKGFSITFIGSAARSFTGPTQPRHLKTRIDGYSTLSYGLVLGLSNPLILWLPDVQPDKPGIGSVRPDV